MKKLYYFISIGFFWLVIPIMWGINVKAYNPPSTLDEVKAWYASKGIENIDTYIENLYNAQSGVTYTNKVYGFMYNPNYMDGSEFNLVIFKADRLGDDEDYDLLWDNTSRRWYWIYNNSYASVYKESQQDLKYDFNAKMLMASEPIASSNSGYVRSTQFANNTMQAIIVLSDQAPSYNFNDIYYSAQIPVPDIDIYMGSDVVNPSSGEAVWNASMEFGDNAQYYIQYGYKASFPSYIDVGLASLRGDFSYNYYNYTSTNYIDIVSLDSLTTAVNQSKPASYFQSAWQSFYDDYLTQSLMPEFGTQVNAMSAAMLDDAKDYYVDYMLGQMPMYGNRLEVFARYFIIDSENDNRVVVGAWNHWSSKDGSRTKERPSNYIDNVALPGYINSSNDVEYQDNTNSFDSLGTSTGVPATIINNNYVPNYPDYPTIASYNKDNLLVSSIDKLNEVKGFFGEFNDFLAVTFVWVPDWIWALIGIGFSLSIIVFFLRML